MVHSTATGQGAVIVGNVSVFHNRLAMHRSLLRMASSGMGSCWPQPRQQILYANRGSGQRRTYIIHSLRLTYNRHSLRQHSHFSIFVTQQGKYDKLISPVRQTVRFLQNFRLAAARASRQAGSKRTGKRPCRRFQTGNLYCARALQMRNACTALDSERLSFQHFS